VQEPKLPEFFAELEYNSPDWDVFACVYRRRADATPELVHREQLARQAPSAQPAVPLTDEQIYAIGKELGMKCRLGGNPNIDLDYARAIEAAHGITEKGQP
jgi:hypothetical protein